MIQRTLPPVHSPLTAGVLAAGWSRVLAGDNDSLSGARQLLLRETGAGDIRLTGSGTTALALALRMAVVLRAERPRVALPGWGCYDLATAADSAGVEVLLYDLDPKTLGPDWYSFDRVLGRGVAAAVVVHPYGIAVDLLEASRRVSTAGALLIEDAAQAIGSTVGGRPLGTTGHLGVMSFGRGKGWTGGGGGALLLNRASGLRLPDLSASGEDRGLGTMLRLTAQWLLARPMVYGIPAALPFLRLGQTIYRDPEPVVPLSRIQATILLATHALQGGEAERRRCNAERLTRSIDPDRVGRVPAGWSEGVPGYLRLPVLAGQGALDRFSTPQAHRLGIMPGYPLSLADLPGIRTRLGEAAELPGARELARRLHTLPTHGLLIEQDLRSLEAWLRSSPG